jgi:hypothetical protein
VEVWVLSVEGNTDHYFSVLSVHRHEKDAREAMADDAKSEIESGAIVEGENDEDGDIDWTRSYTVEKMECW